MLVLLELEDVLVETGEARREALDRSLRDDGVTSLAALDHTGAELATLRAERYFAARLAAGMTLVEGAAGAVESFARRAFVGAVTALRREPAALVLALAGLEGVVRVTVAADDVRRGKPNPEGHDRALARLNRMRPRERQPNECDGRHAQPTIRAVALESSGAGVRAAREAGLRVVGVGAGARPERAVDASEAPDLWVPTVAGLTYDSLDAALTSVPTPER